MRQLSQHSSTREALTPQWRPRVAKIIIIIVCVRECARACALSHVWFCDPMGCRLPASPVHRIFQARILEWVTISFFRESSPPKDWTLVSCISGIGRWVLYQLSHWGSPSNYYNKRIINKQKRICKPDSCHFFFLHTLPSLSCQVWDLAPWPEIEPRLPALAAQSLSHWTTKEVLAVTFS